MKKAHIDENKLADVLSSLPEDLKQEGRSEALRMLRVDGAAPSAAAGMKKSVAVTRRKNALLSAVAIVLFFAIGVAAAFTVSRVMRNQSSKDPNAELISVETETAAPASTPALTDDPGPAASTPDSTPESTPDNTPDNTPAVTAAPETAPAVTATPDTGNDYGNVPFVITQNGRTYVPRDLNFVRDGDEAIWAVDEPPLESEVGDIPVIYNDKPYAVEWRTSPVNYYVFLIRDIHLAGGKVAADMVPLCDDAAVISYHLPTLDDNFSVILAVNVAFKEAGADAVKTRTYAFRINAKEPALTPTPYPEQPVRIESIKIDTPEVLFVGEPVRLMCTVTPADHTEGTVLWEIYDGSEYGEIDPENGTVTGLKPGSFTLKAYVDTDPSVLYYKMIYVETRDPLITPDLELDEKYRPEADPQGLSNEAAFARKQYLVYNTQTPDRLPSPPYSPYSGDITYYVRIKRYSIDGLFDRKAVKISFYSVDREYVGYSYTNSEGIAMFTVRSAPDTRMYFHVHLRDGGPDLSPGSGDLLMLSTKDYKNCSFRIGNAGEGMSISYEFEVTPHEYGERYSLIFKLRQSGETVKLNHDANMFSILADFTEYRPDADQTPDGIWQITLAVYPGLEEKHVVAVWFCLDASADLSGQRTCDYEIDGTTMTIILDDDVYNDLVLYGSIVT